MEKAPNEFKSCWLQCWLEYFVLDSFPTECANALGSEVFLDPSQAATGSLSFHDPSLLQLI